MRLAANGPPMAMTGASRASRVRRAACEARARVVADLREHARVVSVSCCARPAASVHAAATTKTRGGDVANCALISKRLPQVRANSHPTGVQ